MSLSSELWELRKKRKKEDEEDIAPVSTTATTEKTKESTSGDLSYDLWKLRQQRQEEEAAAETIAPIVTTGKDEEEERTWFQSGALKDGASLTSIGKTILGTVTDAAEDFGTGFLEWGEKAIDTIALVAPYITRGQFYQNGGGYQDLTTQKLFNEQIERDIKTTEEFANKDLYDGNEIAKKILSSVGSSTYLSGVAQSGPATKADLELAQQMREDSREYIDTEMEDDSVLAERSDAFVQTAGKYAADAVAAGAGAPWYVVTALTTFGGKVESALNEGATGDEAKMSALISTAGELLSGKLVGGMLGEVGLADEAMGKFFSRTISNKFLRNLANASGKGVGEGLEELFSFGVEQFGDWLTYQDDKTLKEMLLSEEAADEAIESFIGGFLLGGGVNSINAIKSGKQGVDYASGLTENEQKVVDKVYKDEVAEREQNGKKLTQKEKSELYDSVLEWMDKGYISTDTIEEVLGGEEYGAYRNLKSEADEFNTLYDAETLSERQRDRLAELKEKNKAKPYETALGEARGKLSQSVSGLVKGDRLVESYNERLRATQDFEADFDKYKGAKYEEAARKTLESVIALGASNTNRVHDMVDLATKTAADTGLSVTFASGEQVKSDYIARQTEQINEIESIPEAQRTAEQTELLAEMKDQLVKVKSGEITVNGNITEDGIVLNIDSSNPLNRLVGHEVTHSLKKTAKNYQALHDAVMKYAKDANIDIDKKLAEYKARYAGVKNADPESEMVADMVGDLLFSDGDFVHRLSTENQNVFQWLWNEIKYLAKVATAGSREARDLARVQKAFEEAYRANYNAAEDGGVQYSISKTSKIPYGEQLEQIENGKMNGSNSLYVGRPSGQLQSAGFSDAPFAMNQGDYRKSRRESGNNKNYSSHSVPYEFFENMPQHLSDAPALIDNGGRVSVVTSFGMKDTRGNDSFVIAGVWANQKMDSDTVNQVKSVYPLDDFAEQIKKAAESGKLVVINENKAEQMLATIGVQPAELSSILNLAKGTLSQANPTVKAEYSLSDSKGRELSPAVQKRFGSSKVVDENGSLKVVYHGTATGEFSIFDKSKGSVEGDFGSGFYFTDNEADVSEHYEGGGPDFDNKIARLAEQIEAEEDIDYEEAKERAREELYKGSHKFEVYLNIENPAIVGETMLLTQESYLEQYNEEDYDDYDDYIADVEQLVADDVENIVWEVEKNVDVYRTDGLADVLYEAYYEGGIGIEELKAKINELYLEDSNGNLVGNEVARQIIESLGYDGIIDPTVSGKWNMDIEEGTTHYIVFKPNQIKSVTNENPTDNPDINLSLSDNGERFAPLTDFDFFGKDFRKQKPVQETAPVAVAENATTTDTVADLFPDDMAPVQTELDTLVQEQKALEQEMQEAYNADDADRVQALTERYGEVLARVGELENEISTADAARLDSLTDADVPPEVGKTYQVDTIETEDPFYERDIGEVGNRKVKAYMYENPEVKPFFQREAMGMLNDLRYSTKGERWFISGNFPGIGAESYYRWGGTKRSTTDDIAYLLDNFDYTYDQIEKGLNAIIEDNGAENNAVSKRIEFMLNDRLMYGYKDFEGRQWEANQDYINLVNEKNITEYSKEAFDALMANADDYAPISEEIEPMVKTNIGKMPLSEYRDMKAQESGFNDYTDMRSQGFKLGNKYDADDIAPVVTPARAEYEAIRPKPVKEPRMAKATPQEQARANILVEEPKVEKKKPGAWNLFKDNFVDKGTIFETLSLETGNRELQGRWKSIGRAESSAQWFMEHGNASTSSLKSIRETVENSGKTQQFYEYLYHKHNVDRMNLEDRYEDVENKPVFGYDVTSEMSKEEAAKLEAANPEFKEWSKEVYDYMTYLREMMVDSGVISHETAKLWAEMYPHYVPVRRKGDEGLNINVALDTKRTGVNAPVKRATGGNRDILPLFDTMALRTEQTFKAVARNRFGVELKNMLGTTIENEAVGIDEAIDSVETELLQEGKDGRNPTFTVFENGEKVTFEITEEMYDTMKPKSKAMSYTNKALNTANNIRRGLLTEYNPAFMLTNPIKDTQDVLMNSQHPARTYANYPKAIAELWGKKGQYYQEYMEHGGEQNTYFDGEAKTFVKEKSGLSKAIGFPLEKISQANNFIERIPRMAEYIASRQEGRSIDVSMLDAARVTTDFSAGGDLVKFANRNGFTFLNASVQGAVQQVRNVREAKAEGLKGWAKLAAKVAVAGLPSVLLNHLLWDDDEEYAELSDYVKQNYYIVGKYGDGKFVRIPKGRALAVIQNGLEQMESLVTGNDEVDLEAFAELVISNLAPSNPLENNLIAPITQALGNKTWYGDDLVPTRLQDLPAEEQYDETTDSISKWLGEKLNISPYKINYVLDQYSGGVGDMLLPMITPEAERGNNTLLAPVLDKFTTDSVMKNQNVSDFYTKKDELTTNAKASGATDEDVLMNKYMNSINSELSDLYAEKRRIQNTDLSDTEKYEAVRDIQKQIVDLTREGLATYDDISYQSARDGEYANIGNRYFKLDEEGEWQKLSDEQATKYKVTSAAGDSSYASDGENHYHWYVSEDGESGWRKITDDQLEKQKEVTKGLGISPEEYWGNKDEYDYAYKYPENYAVAKAVGGYDAYKGYSSELYDIKADKDENGKSISGSRKDKVLDYINGLDADYGEKLILFKNEYNADDTYNYEIIDYLNSRNDISYEEMVAILKKLGFNVSSDGIITW